jgi:hypothetical protein
VVRLQAQEEQAQIQLCEKVEIAKELKAQNEVLLAQIWLCEVETKPRMKCYYLNYKQSFLNSRMYLNLLSQHHLTGKLIIKFHYCSMLKQLI